MILWKFPRISAKERFTTRRVAIYCNTWHLLRYHFVSNHVFIARNFFMYLNDSHSKKCRHQLGYSVDNCLSLRMHGYCISFPNNVSFFWWQSLLGISRDHWEEGYFDGLLDISESTWFHYVKQEMADKSSRNLQYQF